MVTVQGTVEPGFEGVREAFAANFDRHGEVGAAVCIRVDGRTVVDLWGGAADPGSRRPWTRDTLVNHYSAGKPLLACLLLRQVDAGVVGLDDRIAEVWPEFAGGGKAAATVRHALCHTAGVPAITRPLANDDLWSWPTMAAALAATPAWYPPGTRVVYHANTYGHLLGELVRRLTGELPGALLSRLAADLDADVHVGVRAEDLDRCATVLLPDAPPARALAVPDESPDLEMIRLGYFNPPAFSSFGAVNTTAWRQAQIPSTNGHGSAAGLCAFYAGLLQPGRLLGPELLAEATRVQAEGDCPFLAERAAFGLGFVPTSPHRPFGPNPGAYGHYGTGGAVGFADPSASLAFGYVMNHVIPRWRSRRNQALIDALYAAL